MLNIEHFPNEIVRIQLDRPDQHNTLNGPFVAEITNAFMAQDVREARAVILTGNGRSFCAGVDPEWLAYLKPLDESCHLEATMATARMFAAIDQCPAPVIAAVHGFCLGGGIGLAAVADMVTAHPDTRFAFNELRLGIAPAVVAPYALRAIGVRHARRLMLTGERFSAEQAYRWGLVHHVERAPRRVIEEWLGQILENAPGIVPKTKMLIEEIAGRPVTRNLRFETACQMARDHVTPEALEGMSAFLEKRKPSWSPDA